MTLKLTDNTGQAEIIKHYLTWLSHLLNVIFDYYSSFFLDLFKSKNVLNKDRFCTIFVGYMIMPI